MGKIKIFNDPVYGFVRIRRELSYRLIGDERFQRLRRIKQLGLTDLVYPGANHTRFHHTLGAVHLMNEALDNLRLKGIEISEEESEAAELAILLHDIGHWPFSHALEHSFIRSHTHEEISLAFMNQINGENDGALSMALDIFQGRYNKKFLCQLVSGQLDIDRLDYLRRDSFYTGVSEGVIGSDRIIKMMNVVDDELVVDEKGIYSIEKFLIARNLMYWQVYLHKTVVAAELLMVRIIQRARELLSEGTKISGSPALLYFLSEWRDELNEESMISFSKLDDHDLMSTFKQWADSEDPVLSELCSMIMKRRLYRIELSNGPMPQNRIDFIRQRFKEQFGKDFPIDYFVFTGEVSNTTYQNDRDSIKILYKNGELKEFEEASRQYDLNVLTKEVQKQYICYPKSLILT